MTETLTREKREEAVAFLNLAPDLDRDAARRCVENSDRVVVYRDGDNGTVGCGTFRLWGKERNKADLYLYVRPESRCAGIGAELLNVLTQSPECGSLRFTSTKVETNIPRSLDFFALAGYEKWYTEFILAYSGERQPESEMKFINYDSCYFEEYVSALRNSFYELRSANDFEPYYCCEPDENKRAELEKNKDSVFLLTDNGEISASVTVNGGFIEDVFVVPAYQGRGIGKKLMRFAVNRAMDNGFAEVKLDAIGWNTRALKLYESVGFRTVAESCYLRRFACGV